MSDTRYSDDPEVEAALLALEEEYEAALAAKVEDPSAENWAAFEAAKTAFTDARRASRGSRTFAITAETGD